MKTADTGAWAGKILESGAGRAGVFLGMSHIKHERDLELEGL